MLYFACDHDPWYYRTLERVALACGVVPQAACAGLTVAWRNTGSTGLLVAATATAVVAMAATGAAVLLLLLAGALRGNPGFRENPRFGRRLICAIVLLNAPLAVLALVAAVVIEAGGPN